MFQFKRGRLYVSELSFCIPENSYINSELTTDNSIGFISFDTKTIWYYVIGEGPDGIEEGCLLYTSRCV